MSIGTVAAQQNAAAASTGAGSSSANTALTSLSSNFTDFLHLLMTQLQNQDPSNPLDTNQFTSELVQFSSVEQQINTNSSLTQLIQLTQAEEVMQSSSILGKQVAVQSTKMPLQDGSGSIQFATSTAQPVAIAVYNAEGVKMRDAALTSVAGTNNWTWDGKNNNGVTMPDGLYTVAVTGTSGGTSAALPFSVTGKATAVINQNGGVQLQVGALSVPFSSVQWVGN